MSENLKGAQTLPFVAIITPDLKWVGGFSGFKSVDEFLPVLDDVEKSPVLQAGPDVAKKLEAFLAQAAKSAEKGDWKSVVAASKSAADLKGRSPVRAQLKQWVVNARAWAEAEFGKTLEAVKTGADRATVRASLSKISSTFAGDAEQKEADAALKAVAKLTTIEALPAEQQDAARDKAAKDFAGSRWAAIFDKSVPKPAEKPADKPTDGK